MLSKEQKREQARLRKQRQRDKEKVGSVTLEGVTEMVPASFIEGLHGKIEFLPERPRYLKLSDGQVLDRANQPTATKTRDMRAANEAYSGVIRGSGLLYALTDKVKRKKLERIREALDKTMTGLDGRPLKLSSMVRYGIEGPTFDIIGELLEATE